MKLLMSMPLAVALCISTALPATKAASFLPLGDFSEGVFGSASGNISGDGQTVVGRGTVLGPLTSEASKWTSTGNITSLRADFSDDGFDRHAIATSFDGTIVVGTAVERMNLVGDETAEAFISSQGDEPVGIGTLPGDIRSFSSDVSSDGSVIVGTSYAAGSPGLAFRWTDANGILPLGTLPSATTLSSNATAVSGDGSVIVGTASSGSSSEAFRWTEQTGLVGLGDLPGGLFASGAEDISADGLVIVGSSSSTSSDNGTEAYRWTAQTQMVGLGFLNPFDDSSTAELTSFDGGLVFGFSEGTIGADRVSEFYVWDTVNGMRGLTDVLVHEVGIGSQIAGWSELRANGISDDGLTLAGTGRNPDGNEEAWIVQLDRPIGVPEPATLSFFVCGLLIAFWPCRAVRHRQG